VVHALDEPAQVDVHLGELGQGLGLLDDVPGRLVPPEQCLADRDTLGELPEVDMYEQPGLHEEADGLVVAERPRERLVQLGETVRLLVAPGDVQVEDLGGQMLQWAERGSDGGQPCTCSRRTVHC
jgi:hypothetical protein